MSDFVFVSVFFVWCPPPAPHIPCLKNMKKGEVNYEIVLADDVHVMGIAVLDRAIFRDEKSATVVYIWTGTAVSHDMSYVAVGAEGNVLGYILCATVKDELNIVSFGVQYEMRNNGIGTALMNTVVKELLPIYAKITLMTNVGNDVASKIYNKHGFEIVETQVDFYKDDEGAWTENKDAYKMILQ